MDKSDIFTSEYSFQELTFQYLTSCMKAFEDNEMLSTVVMGAVFSEAILKDICKFFGIEIPKEELNPMIEKSRKEIRSMEKLEDNDKYRLLALFERCSEIRLKRNSLLHDNGVPRKEITAAAKDVYTNVMDIVGLYVKTDMASRIKDLRKEKATKHKARLTGTGCSVFISTITPHTVEQKVFLNAICNQLTDMGITPVRCEFDDYDRGDPMGKVRKTIESCDAFLVIGLERSHSYLYRDKEFSPGEKEGIHRKHTSGWLHVESGIAMALNKKIFVLCQKDIFGDGVFDRDWNSYIVVEFPTPLDAKHNKVQMTLRKIRDFAESCGKKAPEKDAESGSET